MCHNQLKATKDGRQKDLVLIRWSNVSSEETFEGRPGLREGGNLVPYLKRTLSRQKQQDVGLGEGFFVLKNSLNGGQCV